MRKEETEPQHLPGFVPKKAKEVEMEFTPRKLWKIEKLRKDLDKNSNEETRVMWAVSSQQLSVQLSCWSAARNVNKED